MLYILGLKNSSVRLVIPAVKFHAFVDGHGELLCADFAGRLNQLNKFLAHNNLPFECYDWEVVGDTSEIQVQ